MPDLSEFSSWWQILLFAVGVYVIVQILRTIIEGLAPGLKINYYWREVVTPTAPAVIGLLLCIKFPFPTVINTWSARLVLGICGGQFSGWGYKVIKAVVKKFTGVDVDPTPGNAPTQ